METNKMMAEDNKVAIEEMEQQRIDEWVRFMEGVCQEKNPLELLGDKAWERIEDGLSPVEAYYLQQMEDLEEKLKELQKVQKESKSDKKLVEKSPGSAASLYGAVQADPFVEGLMAAKRR